MAGPVVAGGVILLRLPSGVLIDDSKRLSSAAREAAFSEIVPHAAVGIGFATPEEIDRLGIHRACHLAMLRALRRLPVQPDLVLVDGPWVPDGCLSKAVPIVGGDARSLHIACASIVAKVVRDRMMRALDRILPAYGFQRHKGYGTPEHLKALREIGASNVHRFSFRPVRDPQLSFP